MQVLRLVWLSLFPDVEMERKTMDTQEVTRATVAAERPWTVLIQIWRGKYPPEQPRAAALTLIVKLVVTPVLIVRSLSPNTLLKSADPSVIDAMVLSWAAATTALLFFRSDLVVPPGRIAVFYASFRIADTMSQRLMEILVHSVRPRPLFAGIQRSLLLGAVNLYELLACFALVYWACGSIVNQQRALSGPTEALYFSTVTGFTVGFGDFFPVSDSARRLVMTEIAVVSVFVIAWFPTLAAFLFTTSAESSRTR